MKRFLLFLFFVAIMGGAYYYYDQYTRPLGDGQEVLTPALDKELDKKASEFQKKLDLAKKEQEETLLLYKKKKEELVLKEKELIELGRKIKEKRAEVKEEKGKITDTEKDLLFAQIQKYKTSETQLRERLDRVHDSSIVAQEKVVAAIDAKVTQIDQNINAIDRARLDREAKILAKSNVPDPEKFMKQRDANREEAEAQIVRLREVQKKLNVSLNTESAKLTDIRENFNKRADVKANLDRITQYEKMQQSLAEKMSRMGGDAKESGSRAGDSPEVLSLIEEKTKKETQFDLAKVELKSFLPKKNPVLDGFDRSVADIKDLVQEEDTNKEKLEFAKKVFYSFCALFTLLFIFLFLKMSPYEEA